MSMQKSLPVSFAASQHLSLGVRYKHERHLTVQRKTDSELFHQVRKIEFESCK